MKKSIFIITVILLFSASLFAQERSKMRPKDRLIIGLFTDIWSDLPNNVNPNTINRGISIDYIQDFPISTSNFSLGVGLGFASHNLYSDNYYERFVDSHEFNPIGDIDYKNNKLSLNYLNLPVEVRYRTRNLPRTFRIHAGVKAGLLVDAHTKYVGNDRGEPSRDTKFKEGKLDNLESFLIGFHARIGYGRINLNAYMPLINIFEGNAAEDATFMSLGLSFIVF